MCVCSSVCSCWDFAGQTDDYVTHDFFLTSSNTIFLVLVKMNDPTQKQKQQLLQWLRFIKTCHHGPVDLDSERRSTANAASKARESLVVSASLGSTRLSFLVSDRSFWPKLSEQRLRMLCSPVL